MTSRPKVFDGAARPLRVIETPARPASSQPAPVQAASPPEETVTGFSQMLDMIGHEVERRTGAGEHIDLAYALAIPEIFKRLVEGRKTEAFEDRIIAALRSLSRASGGRPVRTTRLATELGQSTWATWYYLTRLETRGLIFRPGGKKSGWLAR